MILDALLKTRSRIVLFDIISKNGSFLVSVMLHANFYSFMSWI